SGFDFIGLDAASEKITNSQVRNRLRRSENRRRAPSGTLAARNGWLVLIDRLCLVSIEAGAQLKHFRLSSRNIINDLRKNLARFGVAGDVSLINRRFFDEATISEVRQRLSNDDVGPVRFRRRQ